MLYKHNIVLEWRMLQQLGMVTYQYHYIVTNLTEAALVFDTLAIFNETILGLGNLITLLRLRNTRQCNQIYDQVDPVDDNILRALLQSQTQGITGNVQFSERGERQNYSLNIVGLSRNGIMKVGEWHSTRKRGFEWKDKWTYAKPPMAIDAENATEFCEASSQRNCGEPDIIMYSATAGIYSTYSDINEDKVLRITTVEVRIKFERKIVI
ncbi:putative glutamate receptor ionotropic, kainate 4 isoform X4 [Apostichopus japonicus]|uniref:Putative glutamate receptor ionotropic, kainate 4 isoform X4 n=1 Tax=Stichopus japonicus TaxID=307972 RepID=A0A2G8JGU0_STIJA|nr:putative glutamate receptor ionotropic, kainate 4 isoform X4 [Apostichopus japonicus]